MKRSCGVLMPISSLHGDYSSGSFGREAKEFIDFLSGGGFTYWQVLPFCMVDECNSPYKSYSAFGGNSYFVDLNELVKEGLLKKEELLPHRQQTPYSCEYGRLYHTRRSILALAAGRVRDRSDIEAFIESHPYLSQFCTFMAMKEANGQKPWNEWTVTDFDDDAVFFWKFVQYEFFTQWGRLKAYAHEKGIKIIGDIPMYVAYDSCDVWANREQFLLDERGRPSSVAGVPPDYFCEDGQLWGNPLYDWDYMAKDNFSWWRARLDHMFTLFDGIRIDHFRAIESYYSIPQGAQNARGGHWVKGPGMAFVRAVQEVADGRLIIAEDLGDITKDVAQLVKDSGFPGMRVLQFGFLDKSDNPHLPHNYGRHVVAYTGTHDNNTLLGYVWELSDEARRYLLSYCGYTDADWNRGYDSILRTMLQSHADLVILPIQDLLGYGSDTRLNIPGKADGNWQYRVTREQLFGIDWEKFRTWMTLYQR